MNRLQTLILTSVALVGLGFAANAATTTITTTTTTTTTTTSEQADARAAKRAGHCVTSLTKADNPTTCYDTFTAAMAAATGGKITDAPADVAAAMKDKDLLTRLNASTDKKNMAANAPERGADVLVLTIYCDTDFEGCTIGGGSQSWLGPVCNDSLDDVETSIPFVGNYWNDNFESFKGFNNCWAKVFEHINFGGVSTPWAPELPDLGVLNDEGTSIKVS